MSQVFAAVFIHIIVPLLGILFYGSILKRMKQMEIPEVPSISLFFLFIFYGGWLLIALTAFFWKWSGMATIGFFFLVFISPLISIGISISNRQRRNLTPFHNKIFILNIIYSVIIVLFDVTWMSYSYFKT